MALPHRVWGPLTGLLRPGVPGLLQLLPICAGHAWRWEGITATASHLPDPGDTPEGFRDGLAPVPGLSESRGVTSERRLIVESTKSAMGRDFLATW